MIKQVHPIDRQEMDKILYRKKHQLKFIRGFDFIASTGGLILLLPLFLLVSILIMLDSPGPAIFKQTRIGRNSKPFQIRKFRSMKARSYPDNNLLTTSEDQRVTRVGKFIRKLKIDELPQLINVMLGDMSLVGPRPEVPKFVEQYDQDARQILRVRPGITDLASIEYFDESTILSSADDVEQTYIDEIMPLKHQLNYEYIRNMGLMYNLKIIFKTLARVIKS